MQNKIDNLKLFYFVSFVQIEEYLYTVLTASILFISMYQLKELL